MGEKGENQTNKSQPVDTILYTSESPDSLERARADLRVPDPGPERALGVLTGQEGVEEAENIILDTQKTQEGPQ